MAFHILLLIGLISDVVSTSVVFSTNFKKVNFKNVSMVTFLNFTSSSEITCAAQCNHRREDCYSFTYNIKDKKCSIGSWLIESDIFLDSNLKIYTVGAFCDVMKGLKVLTNGTTSVCDRMSNDVLNYNNSRAACKDAGIGVDLYTMKYAGKYHVIKDFLQSFNHEAWVGIDDIEVEDVFKFVDDGSVLSQELRRLIFAPGEPNDGTKSNCVVFYQGLSGFLDAGCESLTYYLCERSPDVEIDL